VAGGSVLACLLDNTATTGLDVGDSFVGCAVRKLVTSFSFVEFWIEVQG